MKKTILIPMSLLSLLIFSGCSTVKTCFNPVDPYDTTEKILYGTMVMGQAGDYISTKRALDRGAIESNPIYGENPSDGALLAGKAATVLVGTCVANHMPSGYARKGVLGIVSIMGIGVTIHNEGVQR